MCQATIYEVDLKTSTVKACVGDGGGGGGQTKRELHYVCGVWNVRQL